MKTQVQTQKQESHTIQSKTKANRQAPVAKVLQRYKERTVQRESLEDEELLQGKFEGSRNEVVVNRNEEVGSRNDDVSSLQQVAQREALPNEEELVQGKFESIQQQKSEENSSLLAPRSSFNNTGLPDKLKTDVENLSGYSMDDVRVHYNSPKPAQLQALAYTQGTDIHVGPGQEKHLPHEAWHVVQQKQGRVQPTMQLRGVNVNDNEGLEREADMFENKIIKQVNPIQKKWKKSYRNLNNVQLLKLYISGRPSDLFDWIWPKAAAASSDDNIRNCANTLNGRVGGGGEGATPLFFQRQRVFHYSHGGSASQNNHNGCTVFYIIRGQDATPLGRVPADRPMHIVGIGQHEKKGYRLSWGAEANGRFSNNSFFII